MPGAPPLYQICRILRQLHQVWIQWWIQLVDTPFSVHRKIWLPRAIFLLGRGLKTYVGVAPCFGYRNLSPGILYPRLNFFHEFVKRPKIPNIKSKLHVHANVFVVINGLGALQNYQLRNNHCLVVLLLSSYTVKLHWEGCDKYFPNFSGRCVVALDRQTHKVFPPILPHTCCRMQKNAVKTGNMNIKIYYIVSVRITGSILRCPLFLCVLSFQGTKKRAQKFLNLFFNYFWS